MSTTIQSITNAAAEFDESFACLLGEATAIRDRHWGRDITYSRKVFIPLTNMCRDECAYCAFVKHPDSPDARLMTPQQVLASIKTAESLQCKEALFSLGEKPERRYPKAAAMLAQLGYQSMIDYLRDMCELTLKETTLIPHVNAGTLNEAEIRLLKPVAGSMGMMLETLNTALLKKGGSHYRCPDKAPKPRLNTIRIAGELQVPFTTGILIGIGESWQDRIDALTAINELHRRYGHIQEVIVQNFRAKPGTAMADAVEPGTREMLQTLAAARVILDPEISLQAPPNLETNHVDYLDAGINDWGGISPLTKDFINPERAWPNLAHLRQQTAAKGMRLRERLTVYPEYLQRKPFIAAAAAQRLIASSGADGLASTECF